MKNIVSYKTAQALKTAGFPQPEPEAGQVWYLDAGDAVFINGINARGEIICAAPSLINIEGHFVFNPDACESMPFAPTAADILRELPATKGEHPIALCFFADGVDTFTVTDFHQGEDGLFSGCDISEHANPAEACAAAWLELKKQVAKSG